MLVARNSNIEVAKATLENAKTRLTAGTVTKVDVDRAELALVRASRWPCEASHSRDQTYALAHTLVQPRSRSASAPPNRHRRSRRSSDADHLQLRPDFGQSSSRQRRRQEPKTEASKWSPSVSAFGNARKFNYQNFAFDHYSWAVGLSSTG